MLLFLTHRGIVYYTHYHRRLNAVRCFVCVLC